MNYVLQINDVGGWIRFFEHGGAGYTSKISDAFVTTSHREAKRIKRSRANRFDITIIELTDEELFTARLAGK